jgi:hypothetical protein
MADGCYAKSVAGSVAYRLIAWIVASLVSGWPPAIRSRRSRKYLTYRSGVKVLRVVDRLADGEPRSAGYHVEALVVPGVTVLRWPVGVRGDGDLCHKKLPSR